MLRACFNYFIYTRLFYIIVIIFSINEYFIQEYDKSNYLLKNLDGKARNTTNKDIYYDEITSKKIIYFEEENMIEKNILKLMKFFNSYDTMHFLHISKNGYTNEKNFVFFPFFPKILEIFTRIFRTFIYFKNDMTYHLLIGFIVSNSICLLNSLIFLR